MKYYCFEVWITTSGSILHFFTQNWRSIHFKLVHILEFTSSYRYIDAGIMYLFFSDFVFFCLFLVSTDMMYMQNCAYFIFIYCTGSSHRGDQKLFKNDNLSVARFYAQIFPQMLVHFLHVHQECAFNGGNTILLLVVVVVHSSLRGTKMWTIYECVRAFGRDPTFDFSNFA